jgi:F-type H+-transporting ATPase subunit b
LAGQEEEKKVLQEAGQQVDAQLDQNRQKIVQQVEAARRKLSAEVSSFSQEIAQKILGRTI